MFKKSVIYWYDSTKVVPAHDGKYLRYGYNEVDDILYTVEGGWNSYRDKEGTLYTSDHKLSDEFVSMWAYLPDIDEAEVIEG